MSFLILYSPIFILSLFIFQSFILFTSTSLFSHYLSSPFLLYSSFFPIYLTFFQWAKRCVLSVVSALESYWLLQILLPYKSPYILVHWGSLFYGMAWGIQLAFSSPTIGCTPSTLFKPGVCTLKIPVCTDVPGNSKYERLRGTTVNS